MKQLPKFPDKYWLKFSDDPVKIIPFNTNSKKIARKYIEQLKKLTSSLSISAIYHRGSTALGISGKGDIEIGLIPKKNCWFETIILLTNHYKGIGNLDNDYCRFNDIFDGFDIEIILMRGYSAFLDKKIIKYLLANPELLKEYESVKKKYSFSKKEYNRHKDKFFRKVTKIIPEE